jgi:glucan 1,3-beta-glucosidase
MAQRYARHPALWGIQLLNEPHWDMPLGPLKKFYQDAYKRLRSIVPARVPIVIHDAFRPFEWKGFMTEPDYSNVILDTHLYQAYTDADRKRTATEHIAEALSKKKHVEAISQQLWTIVGEWSLGTPGEVWRGLSPFQIEIAKRAYGDAQLLAYESSKGWFYWSYKLENANTDWNFRSCVERGLLPNRFDL